MSSDSEKYLGTVLVTGGAGVVGSFIVEELASHPSCSKVVATYHSQKDHQPFCSGAEYHVCNIADPVAVARLVDYAQPTLIIHTVSPGPFAHSGIQHRINYEATKELVRVAKDHPVVQAFIYTSSIEAVVLTGGSTGIPVTEESAQLNSLDSPGALSAYGRTKGAADGLVLAANTGTSRVDSDGNYSGRLLTTTIRVGGLYGHRDLKTKLEMLKCVNTPATRFQIGPDRVMHEWVYTENVTRVHILAAQALLSGRNSPDMQADGESFFVTDDSPMSFWESSRKVWIAAGDCHLTSTPHPKIIQIPFWIIIAAIIAGESIWKFMDGMNGVNLSRHHLEFMKTGSRFSVEKAKTRLGYQPVCNTDEGIKRSVAWWQAEENKIWLTKG